MGKRYAWEDEEYTRKLKASKKASGKKGNVFWRLPLVFGAACYILMLLRTPLSRLLFSGEKEPVASMLKAEFFSNAAYFALLLLPPLVCLLLYIKAAVINPMREKAELLRPSDLQDAEDRRQVYLEQYKQYTERKALSWQAQAFFYILLAIELALVAQGVFFSSVPRETSLLYSDLSLLRSGDIPVYEGRFLPTDRPLHNTYGYVMIPDESCWYFSSDAGTLRCPKQNLLSNELMQAAYRVEYLPGTYTVVSVANSDGVILTGPDGLTAPNLPAGHWLYGDLVVRSCTEVYGYDWLSPGEQMAFDLFYGEYYSEAVISGDEPTHSFTLSAPLTKDGYRRALALYNAATYQESSKPWRYDTNDSGPVEKVYVGGSSYGYGPPDPRTMLYDVREKTAEIVAAMPPGLDDAGKCYYLAQYLVGHSEIGSGEYPQTQFQDSDGVTITVTAPVQTWATAYGALIEGRANYSGYASAFSALAREAGINCIYIKGEAVGGEHAWNMVQIDGEWYHIDTASMEDGEAVDETYFLADDAQIAETHIPVSYGELEQVPASGRKE